MNVAGSRLFAGPPVFRSGLAVTLFLSGVVGATGALADDDDVGFRPGNLLVSRSVYDNNPANVVAGTTLLPPNCVAPNCVTATTDGSYPYVWNNDAADGSFGITAKIVLDQLKPSGEAGQLARGAQQLGPPGSADQGSDGHQLFVQIGDRAQSVDRWPGRDVHGIPRAHRCARCLEFQYAARRSTPPIPSPGAYSRVVAAVDAHGRFQLHENQRLQRQQWPRGDPEQQERRERRLHGRQCRQRRKSSAERNHHRRRAANPDRRNARRSPRRIPASRRRSAASTSRNWD